MKKIPPISGIYPDVHKEQIDKHFLDQPQASLQNKKFPPAKGVELCYLICFTNRCGSNFLASSLASDGKLDTAGEFFNYDFVINQSKKKGFSSYQQYMNWLVKRKSAATRTFGAKVSIGQLIHLYNIGFMHAWKDRLKVIHITRKDVMAQAISLSIAHQTKCWTSEQDGIHAEVIYRPANILSIMRNINYQNGMFTSLLDLVGLPTYSIRYEDFVEDPHSRVSDIGAFLGVQNLIFKPENVPLKKQANSLNADFRARMIADFSLAAPVAD